LIAKPALTYIKSFMIIVYSYFALVIGNFVNTGLLYMRGLDEITSPFDASLTGLNLLTTLEQAGAAVYTFLGLVNPFQIWFVVLLSVGLKVFTDIKYVKALVIGIVFWVITIIFPVLSVIINEVTMKNAGLM